MIVIANVQNICNLIGQKEYSIDEIVLLASMLYFLTKKSKTQQNSISVAGKDEKIKSYSSKINCS